MATAVVSSAGGLLALLQEKEDSLKLYALNNLNDLVHQFWFQISSSISYVEQLYEDEAFTHRKLAALLASKVFYYLGELQDALQYALGAENLFDVNDQSEYVQTIIAWCLDRYFQQRQKSHNQEGAEGAVDERLEGIVERMIDRCCSEGQNEQALGIAMEGVRLDKIEEVISRAENKEATIRYCLKVNMTLLQNKNFRQEVLRLIIRMSQTVEKPDWLVICQCLQQVNDTEEVSTILGKLIQSDQDALLAYQIAFELWETEMYSFLRKVSDLILPKLQAAKESAGTVASIDSMEVEQSNDPNSQVTRLQNLYDILTGLIPIHHHLQFLFHQNHADVQILNTIRGSYDARLSVCHSATIFANSMVHCGTTVDKFLRDNLEWLSIATNWAKFGAIAGLGVIHRGHLFRGRQLMSPYLPSESNTSQSHYSEGGALFALGLVYINHGHDISQFLLKSLRDTTSEVVQHGAALGLGLACLGTQDEEVGEELSNLLYMDNAVAGEATGIAIGLVQCGHSADRVQQALLTYAHETQHEKIIRGIAIGLSMIAYGREEEAEPLVEQCCGDQDPILRYGGMYVIGMAYRGTGNNQAIQKLLHYAVSDVSDDVRRAAVLNLGFVLLGNPGQCPKLVSLLAESYNPHVRYGAAMAIGIACAGTGIPSAVTLLEPMLKDAVDYVRQGAMIALALVLVHQTKAATASFRKKLELSITDKHEERMCQMGAIMASGILDAGGRNVTIGTRSHSGLFRRTAICGLAMFTQYWYWYPMVYFLSLAFHPTAFIGLDGNLKTPKFSIKCSGKQSAFEYPKPISVESQKQQSKVPTAILSTTAKAKERKMKKSLAKQGTGAMSASMDLSDQPAQSKQNDDAMAVDGAPNSGDQGGATDGEVAASTGAGTADAKEFEVVNCTRVLPSQVPLLSFYADSRYAPLKSQAQGFVVLKDSKPTEAMQYCHQDPQRPPTESNNNTQGQAAGANQTADGAGGNTQGAQGQQGADGDGEAQVVAPPEPFDADDED